MDIKRITREYWGQSYISEHNLNGIDTSILKNTTQQNLHKSQMNSPTSIKEVELVIKDFS